MYQIYIVLVAYQYTPVNANNLRVNFQFVIRFVRSVNETPVTNKKFTSNSFNNKDYKCQLKTIGWYLVSSVCKIVS